MIYFGNESGSDGGASGAEHEAAQFPIILVELHTDGTLDLDFHQAAGLLGEAARLLPQHLPAALVDLGDELRDGPRLRNRLIMQNHLRMRSREGGDGYVNRKGRENWMVQVNLMVDPTG